MKKLLLSVALIAACTLSSIAQTPQVPNGDFENWSIGTCGDKPSQYITGTEQYYNQFENCTVSSGITKSTNKYSGSYALQLSAAVYNTPIGNLTGSNSVITALSVNNTNQGIDFTGRPTKLIGYTQFTKGHADSLSISVVIMDSNEDEIGYGELLINSDQTGYTKFEITIIYEPTNTNDPSTLVIFFRLGATDGSASGNSVALIDAMSFEYSTSIPTATTNYTSTSPINVFAANKNINFSENVSDVHVINMVGAQKMQETATTKIVNAASLTTGMYIVTYKYNDAYFSKKVVIE